MSTVTAHLSRGAARRLLVLLAAAGLAGLLLSLSSPRPAPIDPEQFEGRAPTTTELEPAVQAAFPHASYAAGALAQLTFFGSAPGVTLQILHSGPEFHPTKAYDTVYGVPVTKPIWVGAVRPGRSLSVRVGRWPSGVYFARLQASDGRIGFAPFVLRPQRLGEHRIAVVLPTLTWQAYNLRDGDSWYADWSHKTASLFRPYLSRGIPYNFRVYDLPFLHWLAWYHHGADVLSDADLQSVSSGAALRKAYRLIVFPGHHEYVTGHEYDVVQKFRDLGGNLIFLSANDFFRRADITGTRMHLIGCWRDLGRPEAALIGSQYLANDDGQHRGPWVVEHEESLPWLFDGTGLDDGASFASAGIEIDHTAATSPKNVTVLAEIPNLLGQGKTAQMTYYHTARGAHVFAAGAFTLAGSVLQPGPGRMVTNLWQQLS